MTQTIEVHAYKYDELGDYAKEKVRNRYIEGMPDWWENDVIEEAKLQGNKVGFRIDKVQYSGFCSQGDGASWSGHVNVLEFMNSFDVSEIGGGRELISALIDLDYLDSLVNVGQLSHRYSHANTMGVSDWGTNLDVSHLIEEGTVIEEGILAGFNIYENLESIYLVCETLRTLILDEAKKYANNIYADLEEAYTQACSEEEIAQHYTYDVDNPTLFTERGDLI